MNGASVIFYAVFVLPLIAFLIWIMRQDKRKGKIGLIVLLITVIGVIAYMYVKKMFFLDGPVYNAPAMLVGLINKPVILNLFQDHKLSDHHVDYLAYGVPKQVRHDSQSK